MESARLDITSHYSAITDPFLRAGMALRDYSFVCNCRQLMNVYDKTSTPVYMMSYRFGDDPDIAVHTSNLIPTFWKAGVTFSEFAKVFFGPDRLTTQEAREMDAVFPVFAKAYQAYLVSHTVSEDPNKDKVGTTAMEWPVGVLADSKSNVLSMNRTSWYITTDEQDTSDMCEFWAKLATENTFGVMTDENRFVVQHA